MGGRGAGREHADGFDRIDSGQRIVQQDDVRRLTGRLDNRLKARPCNRYAKTSRSELRLPGIARHGVPIRNQHQRTDLGREARRRADDWSDVRRRSRHGRGVAMHAGDASKNVADLSRRPPRILRGGRSGFRGKGSQRISRRGSQRISRRNLCELRLEILCDLCEEIRDHVPRSARCIPIAINAPAITEME